MTTNAIMVLAGYLVTVGTVLLWVFFSRQKHVSRTFKAAMGISVRTLPLFVAFLMICQWLAVSAAVAFAVVVAFWVLLGSSVLDPLSMGAVGILYVIQQWVLGWPDRTHSILEPSLPHCDTTSHPDAHVGKTAITSSALRPAGTVILDGNEYPASSELGYIDCGKSVRVIARRGTAFIVCVVDEVSCPTRDGTL